MITATAFSIDGHTFSFRGPVTGGIRPGSYVSVVSEDGTSRLGCVLDLYPVKGTTFAEPEVEGSGTLLSADGDAFTHAHLADVEPSVIAGRLSERSGTVRFGQLVDLPGVPAVMDVKGFGRHTFVCGQSGSGKTYALGGILERLLHDTTLPIIVLDPNSDYVNIGQVRAQSDTGLDDDEYQRVSLRHGEIADSIRVVGKQEGGPRLWLGNLSPRQQASVLGLDPIRDAEETDVALRIIDSLASTRYTPREIRERAVEFDEPAARRLALRIGNLRLDKMGIWADEDHPAVADQFGEEWRAAIVDLGSSPTPQERSIAAAAIINEIWNRRRDRQPVLLVIDEAHNICPQDPIDPHQALATQTLIAIAGEGRKFGIYLVLSTQRPSKIHENVLSQCDNLILMRMNSAADIAHLQTAFSAVPAALIQRSGSFALGEGLISGKIAPDPLLFKAGRRFTLEGGSDVPADWARPAH